jgi:hypothetical protein
MPPIDHLVELKKIVRWFVKEEVKTPLAFFFKVIPYMTASWVAILYAPGLDAGTKFALIKFSAAAFFTLCLLVAIFAFVRPKHLVYGETGHRAEKKLEFGTEKHSYTSEELRSLPSQRNPQQIDAGDRQDGPS